MEIQMAKQLIETIFGKKNKYEIFKETGWNTKFRIYRSGEYLRSYDDLRVAVEWARKEANREG